MAEGNGAIDVEASDVFAASAAETYSYDERVALKHRERCPNMVGTSLPGLESGGGHSDFSFRRSNAEGGLRLLA